MAISFPAVAVIVSLVALAIAILNYRRKSSVSIRGGYSLASSIECDDRYIAYVILENMKDRAVAIYGIYLAAGYNHYILVEDFEESPYILRPYETLRREYGPIEFYAFNSRRLIMEPVLGAKDVAPRLVLSTSRGRYVVRRHIGHWNPVADFFKNRALIVARPIRSTYKTRSVGGNIKYIVDFAMENGKSEVVLLQGDHYDRRRLKGVELDQEALASADALRSFLADRIADGTLKCKSLEVVDAQEWRTRLNESFREPPVAAQPLGLFDYYIAARFYSWSQDRELRKKNRLNAAKRKEQ